MAKVEEDITILTIEMKMVTKIIPKERATLLSLKTSHTYNVSYAKGIDTISQNIKRNCKMNKLSRQTPLR